MSVRCTWVHNPISGKFVPTTTMTREPYQTVDHDVAAKFAQTVVEYVGWFFETFICCCCYNKSYKGEYVESKTSEKEK